MLLREVQDVLRKAKRPLQLLRLQESSMLWHPSSVKAVYDSECTKLHNDLHAPWNRSVAPFFSGLSDGKAQNTSKRTLHNLMA